MLGRAVVEHNLLSASKLYDNIQLGQLGDLLGVSADKAEQVAAAMIGEGRLRGTIDQVDSSIAFVDGGGEPTLARWDEQIVGVCAKVNALVDALSAAGFEGGGGGGGVGGGGADGVAA